MSEKHYQELCEEALQHGITPSNIEGLAFMLYERGKEHKATLPEEFDFQTFGNDLDVFPTVTEAGNYNIGHSRVQRRSKLVEKPWLIQYFIDNPQSVSQWWPFVVPALLNFMDTTNLPQKCKGATIVQTLVSRNRSKMEKSGLVPVFEESVAPLLSFLPPMEDVNTSIMCQSAALPCLSELARCRPDSTTRMNYLAVEGALKPFKYTQDVRFMVDCLNRLQSFIVVYLQSLTVVHFAQIVKVCQQILLDPFVDASPKLISTTLAVLETAMKHGWTVVDKYRFDIMFILAKSKQLNSHCFEMLKPTDEEREKLLNNT